MTVKEMNLGLVLLLSVFSNIAIAGNKKDDEEIKYGFHSDRRVLSSQTIVFNNVLDKRINEIGNRVVKASERPGIKYTFRVVNDSTINAYAVAGGFIYINTGLLDILESEDELAAIIAHEVGHVSNRHQIKFLHSIEEKRVIGEVVGFGIGVGLGVAVGAAMPSPSSPASPAASSYQQLSSQIGQVSLQTGQALGGAIAIAMQKGYGKKQELEADALAIQYAKKAGYDPNASVKVFKRLMSIRDRLKINEKNYISNLINAKPGLEERIERAENLISKAK